jgi:hypothetical protein
VALSQDRESGCSTLSSAFAIASASCLSNVATATASAFAFAITTCGLPPGAQQLNEQQLVHAQGGQAW